MKCSICKNKTTYDKSYGLDTFIVCPDCFNELAKVNHDRFLTLDLVFKIGDIKEKAEKKKGE